MFGFAKHEGGLMVVMGGEESISYEAIGSSYINCARLEHGCYTYYNKASMCSFFIQSELNRENLKVGDSVIYIPDHVSFMDYIHFEYGIVTSFNSDGDPFVKYFNNYTKEYQLTSQLTSLNNVYPYKQQ